MGYYEKTQAALLSTYSHSGPAHNINNDVKMAKKATHAIALIMSGT